MEEKRQFPRYKVEGATTVLGKPGILQSLGFGPIRHPIVNLSQGGAMVRLSKGFPVGSRHELRIEIPKVGEVVETWGEIRWCAQSAKNPADYYVGVEFVDVPADERRKLAGLHDRFAK